MRTLWILGSLVTKLVLSLLMSLRQNAIFWKHYYSTALRRTRSDLSIPKSRRRACWRLVDVFCANHVHEVLAFASLSQARKGVGPFLYGNVRALGYIYLMRDRGAPIDNDVC